jgi:hypothetical protein
LLPVPHAQRAHLAARPPSPNRLRDVPTLRPSGPLHPILAVYDGFFLRGNLTATVRLRGGRVETEEIFGAGRAPSGTPSLAVQLREAKRLLAQARVRSRREKLSPSSARAYLKTLEEHLDAIGRHLAFQRSHPGVVPAE